MLLRRIGKAIDIDPRMYKRSAPNFGSRYAMNP